MTESQFEAVTQLLRTTPAIRTAAREVLVRGRSISEVLEQRGIRGARGQVLTRELFERALNRIRRAHRMLLDAYSPAPTQEDGA